MCDLNWCPVCDNAISPHSNSLYCSQKCLQKDALQNHPYFGYQYPDLLPFKPRKSICNLSCTMRYHDPIRYPFKAAKHTSDKALIGYS
ncbi:hypothetical protein INT43_007677 [Umbelopsis isabellina]|uniref:Uncharacterized protein n=1 Tax=Mortierella isabellina TaxID=91625 RepID=A0A8H7UEJ9_MORIS|nr:hypothetical protein INT43_007677 [Umbelopsis isabellina]